MHKKLKIRVVGALLAVGTAVGMSPPEARAATVWAENGHSYEVVYTEGLTWTAARSAAQSRGETWDLASITSAAENNFVISLLPVNPAYRSHFWLGGSRPTDVENGWSWVDGEAFSFAGWGFGEEPNGWRLGDYPSNKIAFDFRGSWGWNDTPNDSYLFFFRGFVAESASPVPLPGALLLIGPGALALLGMSRGRSRAHGITPR